MDTETQLSFVGTSEEQELAGYAFEAMKRKGILFAANAPIRMTVDGIAKALTKAGGPLAGQDPGKLAPRIEAALAGNPAVFALGNDGEFITTKAGRSPETSGSDSGHTFRERINTQATTLDADAAKEYRESLVNKSVAQSERPVVPDTEIELPPIPVFQPHGPHLTYASEVVIPQHLAPPTPATEAARTAALRPAAEAAPAAPAAPVPTTPSAPALAPAQGAAPALAPETAAPAPTTGAVPVPATPTAPQHTESVATTAPASVPASGPVAAPTTQAPTGEAPGEVEQATEAPTQEQPAPAAEGPAPVTQQAAQAATLPVAPAPTPAIPADQQAPVQAPAAPPPAPAPAPAAPAAPAARPVATAPVEMQVMTPDGSLPVDLREPVDDIMSNPAVADALTSLVAANIEQDSRLVRFGSDIFPEEAVERFSKGDFRRIKDFLAEPETGGVASDTDFMDYVLNRRPEHPDYERLRFSLDFRLLREKKDFEFVGTDGNRLWMEAGTVPVAAPKRKPAEIGQDYRFLEDPAISSVEDEEVEPPSGPLEYVLSYYEYENGVLPYDRKAKYFYAGPVFEDQRASLIQFEIPQLYSSVLVELRFPTGNRGGFIMGLADFFAEHMVPGARFLVLPTDRADNIFEIQFIRQNETEANLLQYDERRGRYVFRPVSYTVTADPTMLLTQEKFGKLHNQKRLEESERKRPDTIISNAFEALGEETDGRYWAILDDLYPVVNLDRPMSRIWLHTLLTGAYPFFYPDENTEGAYFYDPSKRP